MLSRPLSSFIPLIWSVLWLVPIALVASGVVIAFSRMRGADRTSIVDRVVLVWLVASIAAVAVLTLQPLVGGFDAPRPSRLNPISRIGRRDALDNVLLFLPVGFFAALWWRSKARPVIWATGLALVLSLTIEVAQLIVPINRAASIHDIMFNTLGGFAGALAAVYVVSLVERFDRPTDGMGRELQTETS